MLNKFTARDVQVDPTFQRTVMVSPKFDTTLRTMARPCDLYMFLNPGIVPLSNIPEFILGGGPYFV